MEPIPEIIKAANIPLPEPENIWKKRLPIILFGALIVVIIGELIWGVHTYLLERQLSKTRQASDIAEASTPQLAAIPSKPSYKVGENVPITLKVVTGGNPTDSTDVVIKYDPQTLEAAGNGFIELGAIYKEYPVAVFDNTTGVVQISGITPLDENGFSGIGTLATLNFKSKKEGPAKVTFEYQAGSTADSNIVLSGTSKDILSKVLNADIMIISTAVASEKNESSQVCDGYFQLCSAGLKTGKQFCQKGKLTNNQCVFDPGLTVSCGECQIE